MTAGTRPVADSTPAQLRFPPAAGFTVRADFTGGEVSSDLGALVLSAVDARIGLIERLTQAIRDSRDPRYITHSLRDLLTQRVFQMASGYEDGNDANALRHDPLFKLAAGRAPLDADTALACGATHSRLEGSLRRSDIYRLARALVEQFIAEISLLARCTNRDLPIIMPTGAGASDFSLEVAAPVEAICCVKGPSRPYSAMAEGAQAWSFISQLSLNYLSLLDTDARQGAAALRELLGLYATSAEVGILKQVDGLRSIRCEPVITRLPMPGPLCFGRGLQVVLEMDEMFFEGGSAFLLGSVLEHFLARHVSINSFTETVLRTVARGEIMHWPARCGLRPIL